MTSARKLSWLALRKKLKSKSERIISPLRSLPPPPPPYRSSDLMVCVGVKLKSDGKSTLLRLNLRRHAIRRLCELVTKDYDDNNNHLVPYYHHQHPDTFTDRLYYQDGRQSLNPLTYSGEYRFLDYSLKLVDSGQISSNLIHHYSTSAHDPFIYCIGVEDEDLKNNPIVPYTISQCDFTKRIPTWETIPNPLYCPRFLPTMITVRNTLFVFRNNVNFNDMNKLSENVPFGYLYDLNEKSWSEVPFSPLQDRSGYCIFIVAAMGNNILVIDKFNHKELCYDIQSSRWIDFEVPGLIDHIYTIKGKPVTVDTLKTIFWLDTNGEIYAFNWMNSKLFYGPHSGFGVECDFKNLNFSTLLHLVEQNFCIIWTDKDATLHVTAVHVQLHDTSDPYLNAPLHLTLDVVACFRYHLPSPVTDLQEAHLI